MKWKDEVKRMKWKDEVGHVHLSAIIGHQTIIEPTLSTTFFPDFRISFHATNWFPLSRTVGCKEDCLDELLENYLDDCVRTKKLYKYL